MKISNQAYDVANYVAKVALPAVATFVIAFGQIWNVAHTADIAGTITAVDVLLGGLLILQKKQYENSDDQYDGTIDPVYADGVTTPSALDIPDAYEARGKKKVVLKVAPIPVTDDPAAHQ